MPGHFHQFKMGVAVHFGASQSPLIRTDLLLNVTLATLFNLYKGRMRDPLYIAVSFAIGIFASTGMSQSVRVVAPIPGPGVNFTTIQAAVNGSVDGDIVLVKSGAYDGFTINGKSLSIISDSAGGVNVVGTKTSNTIVKNLTSSQRVVIRGLDITTEAFAVDEPETPGLRVENSSGAVWIESSLISSKKYVNITSGPTAFGSAGLLISNCANVVCRNVVCLGAKGGTYSVGISVFAGPGGEGIRSSSSTVVLMDCTSTGGVGANNNIQPPGNGGAGVRITSGPLMISGSTMTGGKGGDGTGPNAGGTGGTGLVNNGSVTLLESTTVAGAAGTGFFGGSAGVPSSGNPIATILGLARHFSGDSPIRELQSATMNAKGVPFEFVGVLISDAPITPSPVSALPECELLLISLATVDGQILGQLDSQGLLSTSIAVPDLVSALQGRQFFLQSIFFNVPMTYSLLGDASTVTVLDSGL